MFKKSVTPFLCIIIALISCAVTFVAVGSAYSVKSNAELNELRRETAGYAESQSLIESVGEDGDRHAKLAQLIDMIESTYIHDYDREFLWENIYRSLAVSIGDAYSQYLTAEEYEAMLDEGDGEFVGIGVHASYDIDTEGIYVFGVIPDSPAEMSGIRSGDIIVAAEGIEASKENYYTMLDTIRGEAGTDVNLTVLRGEEKLDFTVTRADVASENVLYENLGDGIAYMRILSFADDTVSEEFTIKISQAQNDGCTRFIFDVRNNSGGYLNEICGVLDLILPEGPIINIVDSQGNITSQNSDSNCISIEKAVVLCNENTASAAELFTAALRDYDIAEIVGKTTFGKGTMQTTRFLSDGSAMKLSTAFYNPPSNESYDGIGITPDFETELDEEWSSRFYKMPKESDAQLIKAIEVIK